MACWFFHLSRERTGTPRMARRWARRQGFHKPSAGSTIGHASRRAIPKLFSQRGDIIILHVTDATGFAAGELITVRVRRNDNGGWEVELCGDNAGVTCETQDEARRVAYLRASRPARASWLYKRLPAGGCVRADRRSPQI